MNNLLLRLQSFSDDWFGTQFLISPYLFAVHYLSFRPDIAKSAVPGSVIIIDIERAKRKLDSLPMIDRRMTLEEFSRKHIQPMVSAELMSL